MFSTNKICGVLTVGLIALLVFTVSMGASAQTLTFSPTVKTMVPSKVTSIKVRIDGFVDGVLPGFSGGVASVQIGIPGTPGITYPVTPPGIAIEVLDIVAPVGSPFTVISKFIDNVTGALSFTSLSTVEGTEAGDVAEIIFRIRGATTQGQFIVPDKNLLFVPGVLAVTDEDGDCIGDAVACGPAPSPLDGFESVIDASINAASYCDIDGSGGAPPAEPTTVDVLQLLQFTVDNLPLTEDQRKIGDVDFSGEPPDAIDVALCALAAIGEISLPVFPTPPGLSISSPTLKKLNFKRPVTVTENRRLALTRGDQKIVSIVVEDAPTAGLGATQGSLFFNPKTLKIKGISAKEGYQLLAQTIDNVAGEVKFLIATPQMQGLRTGELLQLEIEAIRSGKSELKLALHQVVDINGKDIAASSAFSFTVGAKVGQLVVKNVTASSIVKSTAAQFSVQGQGIESVKVDVFDLSGRKIFDSGFVAGNTLTWNLESQSRRVANGVYFYIVTVRGTNGEIIRSEVQKFVVLR